MAKFLSNHKPEVCHLFGSEDQTVCYHYWQVWQVSLGLLALLPIKPTLLQSATGTLFGKCDRAIVCKWLKCYVCNLFQSSPSLAILAPPLLVGVSFVFFYLTKLIFWIQLQSILIYSILSRTLPWLLVYHHLFRVFVSHRTDMLYSCYQSV